MKVFILSILFLTLSISLATAHNEKSEPADPADQPILERVNIAKVCKNTTSVTSCESTLKSLEADVIKKQDKPTRFVLTVIGHAQNEFGYTAIVMREKMREGNLDKKIEKALSHCVNMYMDMSDQLRGLYLAASSKEFANEGIEFRFMARSFPDGCEEVLGSVGTSGEKLALYKNYKDLKDLASTVTAVYYSLYPERRQ